MRAGVYMGPAGQLVEYKSGCLIYGQYPEWIPGIIVGKELRVYLRGEHEYVLDGWEYLGAL